MAISLEVIYTRIRLFFLLDPDISLEEFTERVSDIIQRYEFASFSGFLYLIEEEKNISLEKIQIILKNLSPLTYYLKLSIDENFDEVSFNEKKEIILYFYENICRIFLGRSLYSKENLEEYVFPNLYFFGDENTIETFKFICSEEYYNQVPEWIKEKLIDLIRVLESIECKQVIQLNPI